MLRKLIWIEEPHFQGCGCSECAWVFKPSGPPAGNSLDEMKEIFKRLRDKEFAIQACTEHPRAEKAKAKKAGFSTQAERGSSRKRDVVRALLRSVSVRRTKTVTPRPWLSGFVLLATLASPSQVTSSTVEIKSPDLNLILQRLEDIQHQDPAQSRPYEVIREYKVLRGYNTQPTSEVMAQINFAPPDTKTYKIIQAKGDSRGERMVRELLDRETDSAKKVRSDEVTRTNYDFIFLRQENFGVVPEYVLRIVPKREDKYLLRGEIWVDASTFRIRRIQGVPAKSPSFWITTLHLTMQFAELNGMWVPVSFDAIATIRFLGEYTLAGLNIPSTESPSTVPK